MPVLEVLREGVECGCRAGVSAEVEAVVQGPVAAAGAEGFLLETLYAGRQETALEDRYSQRPLARAQSGGQPGEGASGAAGDGDHVGPAVQFLAECPASSYRECVAAALGDDVGVLRARRPQQRGQRLGLGLAAVRRSVDEVEAHPVGRAAGEGGVQGAVGEFVAADHAHRGQAEEAARGGRGAQVVGVRAAEGEQTAAGRGREVRRELAPLVADRGQTDWCRWLLTWSLLDRQPPTPSLRVVLVMAETTDPAKLCDLYLRRSNWQDDKTTLKKHERDLRERAAREGLTVRKVWTEELSAFKVGIVREKFDNAIAAVMADEVRHVLVWKLDRLSRQGMGQVGNVLDQFEKKGARLIAHIDGLDSSIPQHRGLFAWMAEQARSESFNTSTRTRSTKAEKKLDGDWPGGQAPYGLRVIKRRTRRFQKEYPTARRIADALLENRAGKDIAEELNSEGLRTRRGGMWRSSTIHQLAHSPAWAGLMPVHERYVDKHGRERWRATDEPLMGEDGKPVRVGDGVITVAERARILAGLRLRTSEGFSGGRRGKPGASSLLSSFGKCGRCGGNMTKGGQQYRCYRRVNLGKSACQGMTVLVKELDWAISVAFMARVRSFSPEHAIFKELAARWLAYEDPETEARRIELNGVAADAQSRLDNLDDAYYVKGRFKDANGEHRYLRLRQAIEGQLESANEELAAIKESVDLSILKNPESLHAAWLDADQEKARMLLRVVLHSFTVLPPRGQGCKRSRFELLAECCFHWVGEKQQPLRRDVERLAGVVLLDEEADLVDLAA